VLPLASMKVALCAGVVFVLSAGMSARADVFTFNFTGLANNASNSTIQNYMNTSVLGGAGTVTLTGAIGDSYYTADGHVVTGPGSGSASYTLRNKDGGTFIVNDNTQFGGSSNDINMLFSFNGATITSVTFDYEIFPDITCAALYDKHSNPSGCGGSGNPDLPDIELKAGTTQAGAVQVFQAFGVLPASPYSKSPDLNPETAPQVIGSITVSGLSAKDLDFVDWPATIGINDVVITTSNPEPATIILLGTVLSLAMFKLRRRKRV